MTEADAKDYWESLHPKSYGLQSVGYVGAGKSFAHRDRIPTEKGGVRALDQTADAHADELSLA